MMEIIKLIIKFIKERDLLHILRVISSIIMAFIIINSYFNLLIIDKVFDRVTINYSQLFIDITFEWIVICCVLFSIQSFLKYNAFCSLWRKYPIIQAMFKIFEAGLKIILTILFLFESIYLFVIDKGIPQHIAIFFFVYLSFSFIYFIMKKLEEKKENIEFIRRKNTGYMYNDRDDAIKDQDVIRYKNELYSIILYNNTWSLMNKSKRAICKDNILSLDEIMRTSPEDIELYYH